MSELYQGRHAYVKSSIRSENLLPTGEDDLNSRQMIKDHPTVLGSPLAL